MSQTILSEIKDAHIPDSSSLDLTSADADEQFLEALEIVEHRFPLEFFIAGELAQLETFAIPSISALLHRTRQYEDDGLKRLDDTKATLYPIFTTPPNDPKREQFIEHLNWVHSHYDISNEDNLYTLLRMFLLPISRINKWAHRELTEHEIELLVMQVRNIGIRMNIQDIPKTYLDMVVWTENYREKHQRFEPQNLEVTKGILKGLALHFPPWMRPLVEPAVIVLLDNEELIQALGLKPAKATHKLWVNTLLASWKMFSRIYQPWRKKKFSESFFVTAHPSYPNGIDYCKMGPSKLIKARNKMGKCPFH